MAESKKLPSGLTHFRKRTMLGFLRTWREVEAGARHAVSSEIKPGVPKEDVPVLRKQMQNCLNPKGGEVSARAHTAELGNTYLSLNDSGRLKFLHLLADEFGHDADALDKALEATLKNKNEKSLDTLRTAMVSPRSQILRQFTALPEGFKFLVDMRADLLAQTSKDANLKALESDLKAILSSWFDVGLLDLVQITWNSPAALLEKLIAYEAVHKIHSWDDLKNRLDADRRVYAFFHNKMPLEPLIFVQVAFVKGFADNIQVLLDEKSPLADLRDTDTAIFYSISNAQKGLTGISFGNFLIKRVVEELSREMKQIKTFATLSPVPGMRAWFESAQAKGELPLTAAEQKELKKLESNDWYKNKASADALKPVLMKLATHYLTEEKKNARPLDPVASFHLFNGARLERMHWLADVSAKGIKQSFGIMVNYHYKLDEIDQNHEDFVTAGKIVASKHVRGYL